MVALFCGRVFLFGHWRLRWCRYCFDFGPSIRSDGSSVRASVCGWVTIVLDDVRCVAEVPRTAQQQDTSYRTNAAQRAVCCEFSVSPTTTRGVDNVPAATFATPRCHAHHNPESPSFQSSLDIELSSAQPSSLSLPVNLPHTYLPYDVRPTRSTTRSTTTSTSTHLSAHHSIILPPERAALFHAVHTANLQRARCIPTAPLPLIRRYAPNTRPPPRRPAHGRGLPA